MRFADGESISGKIIALDSLLIKGKRVSKYTVELGKAVWEGGKIIEFQKGAGRVSFLGTVKIDEVITEEDVKRYAEIICTGEDKSVSRGDRFMQLFDIALSTGPISWGVVSDKARVVDGTEITDEDIPF